ncbi:MAG: transporter substrate-binding domain-containing protein [Bacteroidales bacterium]|nr:transporter substrate-binding domain-containing protein [Bacteroidales bacterium]MBN2758588.1 transporter substrate-binding domain-containing protein [Bacteroidales bacterium]
MMNLTNQNITNKINFLFLSIFLLLILTLNTSYIKDKGTIILVADEWCPYNCNPNEKNPGYMVELAKLIFAEQGYSVLYQQVSWSRAIYGTRKGDFEGIIGTGKNETPDFVFTKNEMGISIHTFYILKSKNWKYNGIKSVENITLGVIENYSYGNFFNDYVNPNKNNNIRIQIVTGDDALRRNIKKLELSRIDATIEDKNVMNYTIKKYSINIDIIPAGNVEKEKVYIAFSPSNKKSAEYANILDKGIIKFRKLGKLKTILDKYGLKDWK